MKIKKWSIGNNFKEFCYTTKEDKTTARRCYQGRWRLSRTGDTPKHLQADVDETLESKDNIEGRIDRSLLCWELPEYRSYTILLWLQSIISHSMNKL